MKTLILFGTAFFITIILLVDKLKGSVQHQDISNTKVQGVIVDDDTLPIVTLPAVVINGNIK